MCVYVSNAFKLFKRHSRDAVLVFINNHLCKENPINFAVLVFKKGAS